MNNKLLALILFVAIFVASGDAFDSANFKASHFKRNLASRLPLLSKMMKSTAADSKFADLCSQFSNFSQRIDHFNFDKDHDSYYQQRYIISDMYFAGNNRPIFFYTGNEGDIQWFCENTGFVWEIASKFQALVVFAEHRYYGQSLPFGAKSFDYPYINYLTIEQAMADYAYLITYLKSSIEGAQNSPVIAFGGSYGGMLSAWFRMKYKNMLAGALAASAPIFQFTTDCDSFLKITTDSFRAADPVCPSIINSSWTVFNSLNNTKGLAQLTTAFKLCKPLTSVDDLKNWLSDAYGNIAMANYPYPASFLGPLPGWPVSVMCSNITNTYMSSNEGFKQNIIKAIYQGINVFANYTGDVQCFDLADSTPFDINMVSWTYQTCTEIVLPMCSNGVNDMFEPQSWDYNAYAQACQQQFGVNPRVEWPIINFGSNATDIKEQTNIIFSNGHLDPWYGGGVLTNINDKLPAIVIQEGAHHLDLRSSNPQDPSSVIKARLNEIDIIQSWIDEWENSHN